MFFDFVQDLLLWAVRFVVGLDSWQQVGALVLIGAVPFLESYLGSLLGVLLGVDPFLAVPAAVLGNLVCTGLLIAAASGVRSAATRDREPGARGSRRREKVGRYVQRLGVPGACLLGPLLLASQITAPTLIALGARKGVVLLWTAVSIVAWGVLFGFFGEAVTSWLL